MNGSGGLSNACSAVMKNSPVGSGSRVNTPRKIASAAAGCVSIRKLSHSSDPPITRKRRILAELSRTSIARQRWAEEVRARLEETKASRHAAAGSDVLELVPKVLAERAFRLKAATTPPVDQNLSSDAVAGVSKSVATHLPALSGT